MLPLLVPAMAGALALLSIATAPRRQTEKEIQNENDICKDAEKSFFNKLPPTAIERIGTYTQPNGKEICTFMVGFFRGDALNKLQFCYGQTWIERNGTLVKKEIDCEPTKDF